MTTMDEIERAQAAVDAVGLPEWVERVEIREAFDPEEAPILEALVVIKAGNEPDGEMLSDLSLFLRDIIRETGTERLHLVDFIGQDEIDAA